MTGSLALTNGFDESLRLPLTMVPVRVNGFAVFTSNVSSISIGSTTVGLCGDRELPRNRVGLALGKLRISAVGRFGFSIVAVDGLGMVRVNVASPEAPINDTFGSFKVAVLVTGVDCRMFNVLSIGGVLYCRSGDFELVRTLRNGDGERLVGETLRSRSSRSLVWLGLGIEIGERDLICVFCGMAACGLISISFSSSGNVIGLISSYTSKAGFDSFSVRFSKRWPTERTYRLDASESGALVLNGLADSK